MEYVFCGYLRMLFPIVETMDVGQESAMRWAKTLTEPRVSKHFIWVELGHERIPDNKAARAIIADCKRLGGKVTRIDFFIDYLGKLDFKTFYELHDNGINPKPLHIHSTEGDTVYVGNRQSARFFRTYDKRAEILKKSKIDIGFDITRFELEVKNHQVNQYVALFMAGNTQTIIEDIQERYQLRGFFATHERAKPMPQEERNNTCFDFIHRYRYIIRKAYTEDVALFLELIGEHKNDMDND